MILKPEFSFPISYYLIPFTAVVGMIIIVMCVVLVSMFTVFFMCYCVLFFSLKCEDGLVCVLFAKYFTNHWICLNKTF